MTWVVLVVLGKVLGVAVRQSSRRAVGIVAECFQELLALLPSQGVRCLIVDLVVPQQSYRGPDS